MTVTELIERLSQYNGEVNVAITTADNNGQYSVFSIQEICEKSPFNTDEKINEILIKFKDWRMEIDANID